MSNGETPHEEDKAELLELHSETPEWLTGKLTLLSIMLSLDHGMIKAYLAQGGIGAVDMEP